MSPGSSVNEPEGFAPDFVPWLRGQVSQWADRYGHPQHRVFPAWALSYIFEVEDDDAFDQTDTLQQGDAGLDGWYFDAEGSVFHLLQAKWLSDPLKSVASLGELRSLLTAAQLLRDPKAVEAGPHAAKLTAIALAMQQAVLDGASVSLDFLVAGRISDAAKSEIETVTRNLGPGYSASFFDTERLYSLRLADTEIGDLKNSELFFALASAGDYFDRDTQSIEGVEKAAMAALDGRTIGDAVHEFGPRLFHANVRYYLRPTNKVNKRMIETLSDEEGKAAFWLYNNGITIVADEFDYREVGGVPGVAIVNPQIVNGAQTSSVFKDRRAHLAVGDVSVGARIIAIRDDSSGRTALERISEFTNSQSPVRPGDLRANDQRHRILQTAFANLPSPVFYERRRGEWRSLSAAQRAAYPSGRVTKEDAGQRFLALGGRPGAAVVSKAELFGSLESEAFNPAVSAQVYMLASELYEQMDGLLRGSGEVTAVSLVPSLGKPPAGKAEGSATRLDVLRRAHKLVCMHGVYLAHQMFVIRYSGVGEGRARVLRARMGDPGSDTFRGVWKYVLRAIREWLHTLDDFGTVKVHLQHVEAATTMHANLLDGLADADVESILAPITAAA